MPKAGVVDGAERRKWFRGQINWTRAGKRKVWSGIGAVPTNNESSESVGAVAGN